MPSINKSIWADYKDWLLDQVGFSNESYDLLMDELHNSPFIFLISRDANRAEDGVYLRGDFAEERGCHPNFAGDTECSVLEMLVALAKRIDSEYIGDPSDEHPEIIFWEMLSNLGLDKCSNRRFRRNHVQNILTIWLRRDFERNGDGSIFPIRHPNRDQTEIEIWSQMNEYLTENYN